AATAEQSVLWKRRLCSGVPTLAHRVVLSVNPNHSMPTTRLARVKLIPLNLDKALRTEVGSRVASLLCRNGCGHLKADLNGAMCSWNRISHLAACPDL